MFKTCGETTRLLFHLSFEHFMTSFLWSKKMRELEIPSDLKFHAELS